MKYTYATEFMLKVNRVELLAIENRAGRLDGVPK